jgi:hypothetical protein
MSAPDCPECGSAQTYERATKSPRFRCPACGTEFATPAGQCCTAGVETLPSGRPYCGDCGRVLEGTDDPRVTEAEA